MTFLVTKRISDPPQLADFAALKCSPAGSGVTSELPRPATARSSSANALCSGRRSVDWSKPDAAEAAERVAKQLMFEYVTGYVEAGNDRLAVYRDATARRSWPTEFKSMIDRMPSLANTCRN